MAGHQFKRRLAGGQKRQLHRLELERRLQVRHRQSHALAGLHAQPAHRRAAQGHGRVGTWLTDRAQPVHHGLRQRPPGLGGIVATQNPYRYQSVVA